MGSEGAELNVRNSEKKGRLLYLVRGWGLKKGGGQLESFHIAPAVPSRTGTQNCSPKLYLLNEEGVHPSCSPQLCMWSGTGTGGQDRAPTRSDRPRDRFEEKERPPKGAQSQPEQP